MRGMTKSAVRLAREALAIGRRTFPAHGGRTSRHDFTQAGRHRSQPGLAGLDARPMSGCGPHGPEGSGQNLF